MLKFKPNFTPPQPKITINFLVTLIVLLIVTIIPTKLFAAPVETPDKNGLQTAINGTGDAYFTFPGVTGVEIIHDNSGSLGTFGAAVNITRPSKNLIGATDPQFNLKITNLVNGILDDSINSNSLTPLFDRISKFINEVAKIDNMSYIKGDGIDRTFNGYISTIEAVKWIRYEPNSTADNFSIYNMRIGDVNIIYDNTSKTDDYLQMVQSGVVNSFIGNNAVVKKNNSFDSFIGNDFHDISISISSTIDNSNVYLAGGGIIGLRSQEKSTTINNISGNLFRNISISTTNKLDKTKISGPFIHGGGIIGLAPSFNPAVNPEVNGNGLLDNLSSNIFTAIKVNSRDSIFGGGIVGISNNSAATTEATISSVKNNIFGNGTIGDLEVTTHFYLGGGGIIGVNAISNAKLVIDTVELNLFAGINIDIGTYLRGGGIIGFQNNDDSDKYNYPDISLPSTDLVAGMIKSVENNIFDTINVNIGILTSLATADPLIDESNYLQRGGNLEGGGIIGGRSQSGYSILSSVSGNVFSNIKVETTKTTKPILLPNDYVELGDLKGGGLIGLSSGTSAYMGEVNSNTFDSNQVTIGGNLSGGGLVGVYSANTVDFTSNKDVEESSIVSFSYNLVSENDILVKGELYGGGILGGRNDDTIVLTDSPLTGSAYNNGNYLIQNNVTADSLHGGGLFGFYADREANVAIMELNLNVIMSNVVNIIKHIEGGGIIGLFAEGNLKVSYIGTISNNQFDNNNITAGTFIDGGGLIGINGTAFDNNFTGIHDMNNNSITKNTITASNGQIMGGILYSYGIFADFEIKNNKITDNNFYSTLDITDYDVTGLNSFELSHFTPRVYGTITIDSALPRLDSLPNKVILSSTSGNKSIFQNNVIHEGSSAERTNSFYFGSVLAITVVANNYEVENDPPQTDALLVINADANSSVELYDPIYVNQLNMDSSVTSPATNRTFGLEVAGSGGDFLWAGQNIFEVGDYVAGSHLIDNTVWLKNLSRTILLPGMSLEAKKHDFNVDPGAYLEPRAYDENGDFKQITLNVDTAKLAGTLYFPINGDYLDNADAALLKINLTDPLTNKVDLDGATIVVGDFMYSGDLTGGDMFYLLEAQNYDMIVGETANATATAKQNLTIEHTFIIDTAAGDDSVGQTNRKLVARLAKTEPAPETKTLTESYAAGLVFLSHIGSWLPDYTYYTAEMAIRQFNAWQAFSGVDASVFTAQTGSHVSVTGVTFVVGVAKKTQNSAGSFLFGGFLEGGVSTYEVVTDVSTEDFKDVGGKGTLRSLGLGLMASQKFENGFRLETSFRYGFLQNDFIADNYVSAAGTQANYFITSPYFGAHFGIGFSHDVGDFGNLDYSAKYYYSHLKGQSVHIGDGETVEYAPTNSHRVRAGLRFTKPFSQNVSFYIGSHFDYEFDNHARAKVYDMDIKTVGIKGPTGIFELGGTIKSSSNEHLSIEFGLQGYVGTFRGLSGGVRLGYEF